MMYYITVKNTINGTCLRKNVGFSEIQMGPGEVNLLNPFWLVEGRIGQPSLKILGIYE